MKFRKKNPKKNQPLPTISDAKTAMETVIKFLEHDN